MVTRYQPHAGVFSVPHGEYVDFNSYEEIVMKYLNIFEVAGSYLDQVALGEISADQAKIALLAIRRLEGL